MSQERENVSLYVSDNVNLEFKNDISLFFINKNFQMTTFNVLVFAINNITVLIVNIMVLIWLQVQKSRCLIIVSHLSILLGEGVYPC